MALPTQFELVSLYYQAIAAGVSPAGALDDVKSKWQIAAKKLREVSNDKEFEMTSAEILAADDAQVIEDAARLAELKIIWQSELDAETAEGGLNRPEVIAELNANLAL